MSDDEELRYRVTLDGQLALANSRLGLDLNGGFSLCPDAKITTAARDAHDGTSENLFGPRRIVPDRYGELKLALQENADAPKRLNLIIRAYDNGVALRYEDVVCGLDAAVAPPRDDGVVACGQQASAPPVGIVAEISSNRVAVDFYF